jgi:hypothetical protein
MLLAASTINTVAIPSECNNVICDKQLMKHGFLLCCSSIAEVEQTYYSISDRVGRVSPKLLNAYISLQKSLIGEKEFSVQKNLHLWY